MFGSHNPLSNFCCPYSVNISLKKSYKINCVKTSPFTQNIGKGTYNRSRNYNRNDIRKMNSDISGIVVVVNRNRSSSSNNSKSSSSNRSSCSSNCICSEYILNLIMFLYIDWYKANRLSGTKQLHINGIFTFVKTIRNTLDAAILHLVSCTEVPSYIRCPSQCNSATDSGHIGHQEVLRHVPNKYLPRQTRFTGQANNIFSEHNQITWQRYIIFMVIWKSLALNNLFNY